MGNNDVLGCNNGWGWNKSITPSAGAAGVGFDALLMIAVANN
jgi:hypothetical protein